MKLHELLNEQVTLNHTTQLIAQSLLQAKLDGKLTSNADFLEVVQRHQPIAGLKAADMKTLTDFMDEIKDCDIIPKAKAVAEKYKLTLSY